LGTFIEVARKGNISRAADALSLSQTAVSWRIRTLETTIGARLFERSGKGVRLTKTGKTFLEHAHRIAEMTDRALVDVRQGGPTEDRIPLRAPMRRGRKRRDIAV
jgi:DNA-binding transcriptional LysR family regulator